MSKSAAISEEDPPKPVTKANGRRKLIMAAAAVLLLVVAGATLWFTGVLSHRGAGAARRPVAALANKPVLIDVPNIVTNLDNGSRRSVFIRLKSKIEVSQASDQVIILADMPQILDAFQTYLRSMRPEDVHGGEGTYRLREALMNRIDMIAAPVQVLDVLFLEVVVQ